jgi:hypothetical protein
MGLLSGSSGVSCMVLRTLNTHGVEPRKLKDKESELVTDRQRNRVVKAKKDCGPFWCKSQKPCDPHHRVPVCRSH